MASLPESNFALNAWERELASGARRLHETPAGLSVSEAAAGRRRAIEARCGVSLASTGEYSMDVRTAKVENLIGVTQIPLGVVGPLRILSDHIGENEEIFVPLATTEGALIASTGRGCRAVRDSGGAVVHVDDVGMTRAPVFRTSGIQQSLEFVAWVAAHENEIRQICESTSRYLRLQAIRPQLVGSTVYLRFRFTCGDAMGMNMATIACARVVEELIGPETGVECVAVSGNYCVDKKPAALNFIEGRGKRIYAETVLSRDVLQRCLKTTASALCEVQYRKNQLGSIMAGALGFNSHYANIVAAFFLATGQDVAQVAEGALGVTCIEPREDGAVYVSVFLPDAPVAAIGGGTALSTQAEALGLLGISTGNTDGTAGDAALRLAQILGAVVLAGEISTLAALSAHHLARAHAELGRPASLS
jgi:hydroxymethylglutaryl-CoA reductase (NADPH)